MVIIDKGDISEVKENYLIISANKKFKKLEIIYLNFLLESVENIIQYIIETSENIKIKKDVNKKELENIFVLLLATHVVHTYALYTPLKNDERVLFLNKLLDFKHSPAEIFERYGLELGDENTKISEMNLPHKVSDKIAEILCLNKNLVNDISKKLEKETIDVAVAMQGQGCYIATEIYSDFDHPNVQILRKFRDKYLSGYMFGEFIMKIYYKTSISMVKSYLFHSFLKIPIKYLLDVMIKLIVK